MQLTRILFIYILTAMVVSLAADDAAKIPDKLIGSWVLDKEATMRALKKAPKYADDSDAELSEFVTDLSRHSFTYRINVVEEVIDGKLVESYPAFLKEIKASSYVIESQRSTGEMETIVVTINAAGLLNHRYDEEEAEDEFQYLFYRRKNTNGANN